MGSETLRVGGSSKLMLKRFDLICSERMLDQHDSRRQSVEAGEGDLTGAESPPAEDRRGRSLVDPRRAGSGLLLLVDHASVDSALLPPLPPAPLSLWRCQSSWGKSQRADHKTMCQFLWFPVCFLF